jgi:hypothetical protein
MLGKEVTNANFIIFGLTGPRFKPTIYNTQGMHANHYATVKKILYNVLSKMPS